MSKYLDLQFEGEFANKIIEISEGFSSDAWDVLTVDNNSKDYSASISSSSDGSTTSYWLDIY